MSTLKEIKNIIDNNEIERAIALLNEIIEQDVNCEEAYFMLGNAYRKLGDWKGAISNYCKAKELNPSGDGAKAYEATIEIMNFYDIDRYNP